MPNNMNKVALIAGVSGLVGYNLTTQLLEEHWKVKQLFKELIKETVNVVVEAL